MTKARMRWPAGPSLPAFFVASFRRLAGRLRGPASSWTEAGVLYYTYKYFKFIKAALKGASRKEPVFWLISAIYSEKRNLWNPAAFSCFFLVECYNGYWSKAWSDSLRLGEEGIAERIRRGCLRYLRIPCHYKSGGARPRARQAIPFAGHSIACRALRRPFRPGFFSSGRAPGCSDCHGFFAHCRSARPIPP